ncbi:DUF6285 domain-containing protein [Advenella sp. FME57]|uniref:Acyl-CoA dehydrogenase n=1 Tax=Advenella kashmirensis TaxID=310575 RepID=A0A356LJ57_9BURK|nr:DUF6285 domain-containing protein [Advenella sp. FME57]HBP31016.1 acyl-CoA dehydrogenase [Advenella kashmirensis]
MSNQPDAHNLLVTARQLLLDELVPVLGEQHRYAALMIANAMGIAAREIRPPVSEENLTKALDSFLAGLGADGNCPSVSAEAVLARLIRHRKMPTDAQSCQALTDLLLQLTRSELRISNPKFLNTN